MILIPLEIENQKVSVAPFIVFVFHKCGLPTVERGGENEDDNYDDEGLSH